MSSTVSRGSGHVCSIIPPYVLHAMATSDHVPDATRASAHHTLQHIKNLKRNRASTNPSTGTRSGTHSTRPPPHAGIVPDHILNALSQSEDVDAATRDSAQRTLEHSQGVRSQRQESLLAKASDSSELHLYREVHDADHNQDDTLLPGKMVFTEGQAATTSSDVEVGQCYDNLGYTFDFYAKVFNRNSIDNRGLSLIGSVHFGQDYGNAYWNSKQMVFGDGNTFIYNFTKALDVIGHELTHGVTENTAALEYHNQSGALNESVSDVFGVMVKQYHLQQKAEDADWLIGEDCLLPGVEGVALRSMKAPGTAFDDPRFGKDPQPATMADYKTLSDDEDGDYGGVHTNSGIPNKAFYLVAIGFGGFAWEKAGKIWYDTLLSQNMTSTCDFQGFADITVEVAGTLFDDAAAGIVTQAWTDVGVYGGT